MSEGVQRTASNVATQARDTFDNTRRAATNTVNNVRQGATNAANTVRQEATNAANTVRQGATNTAQRAGRAIESAADPVVRATDRIADGVRRVTPQAVQNAVGHVANAHRTISNAIDSRVTAGASRAFDVAGRVAGAVGTAADVITGNPKALLTVPATAIDAASMAGPVAGKAASRLLPGANVAAAAVDGVNFVQTLRDPSANTTDKVLAGITAAGSALGATNIPVVSQVAGVVGTAADIANIFFGSQD